MAKILNIRIVSEVSRTFQLLISLRSLRPELSANFRDFAYFAILPYLFPGYILHSLYPLSLSTHWATNHYCYFKVTR